MGSGKSTIASILKKFNIPVIDADEISRRVTRKNGPAYDQIVKFFSKDILNSNGEIDRKKLARIVFNDPVKKKKLEDIIHPLVEQERNKMIEEIKKKSKNAIIALDIPLLFEARLEKSVNYIICAYADLETIYNRVKARDGISKEDFLIRIKNQIPLEEKVKRSHFIIDTRKDIKEIELELKNIIRKIAPDFIFH